MCSPCLSAPEREQRCGERRLDLQQEWALAALLAARIELAKAPTCMSQDAAAVEALCYRRGGLC